MMKKPTKILTYALFVLLLGGCSWLSPFKLDIQQGNILDEEAIAQLSTGMTEEQVVFLLGTPLLTAPDNPAQWDYIYQLRRGEKLLEREKLRLMFTPDDQGNLRLSEINHQP
ncbi:outer membrane protein assembly factor BamE [Marinospirillum alkaliphilum]|uniref:Outer membrane protein assembly factor BamE n=1 Tax=Marinospirillum alkaliphilum DSM 21637 TaxID=1122209 RepID=A0A1K1Y9F3_9GAMM|nr:outer membrane protein assembly factor BamE [Marinospirillum alkaliphilum]SFX57868.1 SmpA / OmlA family protein [Marinospirillum alkaliphilum DSM 21637]